MRKRAATPLLDWQPPLARAARRRRRPIFVSAAIGVALIGLATIVDLAIRPAPRLVWNSSASAPIGLWRVHPKARFGIGDMVLVATPKSVRRLAAVRHYLPANVPLLKRVVAKDGDSVCAFGPDIYNNGRWIAQRHAADSEGRPLPWWSGCEYLRGGRIFLLMDAADSFDGRYFGPVDEASVIGKATPLWLR